jgi:hypothetical protein
MVLWSLAPTQLILGEDVTRMSAEYVATVGNPELIAINQDAPLVAPMRRIVGGDLSYPCTPAIEQKQEQEGGDAAARCINVWARPLANGDVALAFVNQGPANATVKCDAPCLAAANVTAGRVWAVRDLIARRDVGEINGSKRSSFALSALVESDGSVAAFRLKPLDNKR